MAIRSSGIEAFRPGAIPSPDLFPSVSQEKSGFTASCRFALLLWSEWLLGGANGLAILIKSPDSRSYGVCALAVRSKLTQYDERCSHKEGKAACQQINTALHKQAVWRWTELCKEPELRTVDPSRSGEEDASDEPCVRNYCRGSRDM